MSKESRPKIMLLTEELEELPPVNKLSASFKRTVENRNNILQLKVVEYSPHDNTQGDRYLMQARMMSHQDKTKSYTMKARNSQYPRSFPSGLASTLGRNRSS